MSAAPVFAVVGRANKGKSSIVAALAEDDDVETSPLPGTTTDCTEFPVKIDRETIFVLVDTPGFEDAPRALSWMRAHEVDASSRSAIVAEFVRAHEGSGDFVEECRLLKPILAGASILYVVDGTKPYRQNYEAEMEILRWTGMPGMALINRIGEGDHAEEWRRALDQYFRIVRDFDAFRVSFTERMRVLTAFRELRPDWTEPIGRAIKALRADRTVRREETVRALAEMLAECLTFSLELSLGADETLAAKRPEIERRFLDRLRDIEQNARHRVEELYKYHRELFVVDALEQPVFQDDLFAESTWRSFGLDPKQIIAAYAIAGALAGGVIDASVGGASFFLGTAIGGLVGAGAGVRHAAQRAGGDTLAGVAKNIIDNKKQQRVGPLSDVNFPFILLDRAVLHYRSVLSRTHAQRDVVRVEGAQQGIVSTLPLQQRNTWVKLFQKVRKSGGALPDATRAALHDELRKLLDAHAPEGEPE